MKENNVKWRSGISLGVMVIVGFLIFNQFNYVLTGQEKDTLDSKSSPSEVVKDYWHLASEGKFEQAEALKTYCELPTETGAGIACGKPIEEETYAQLIYRMKFSLSTVESEKIRDKKAIVIITMVNEKGMKSKEQYNLFLTKDGWRISFYHSAQLYPCEFIKEDCQKGNK